MKQVAKRILSFVFALCLAVLGVVVTPTVNARAATTASYVKVTEAPANWTEGEYLIACESSNVVFDGSTTSVDSSDNDVSITIQNGEIAVTDTLKGMTVTIEEVSGGYAIKTKSGYYIGHTADSSNTVKGSKTTKYVNTISMDGENIHIESSGKPVLRYNATDKRFRYYKSSSYKNQKAIQLYKYVEVVVEDTDEATAVKGQLNAVEAKMSLAFTYTKKSEIVEGDTDTLNRATTGITATSYSGWSGKTANSSAVYAGNSAGGNEAIQLRATSPSGVVTTTSGGKVAKIVVAWNSNTGASRTLDVYGKNTAYSAATDLYSTSTQGTLLGSIKNGTTELVIEGDYEYIGFRSNDGALYLDEVQIEWKGGEQEVRSDGEFRIRCAVPVSKPVIEGIGSYSYGVRVSTNGKTKDYFKGESDLLIEKDDNLYVVISLGDAIKEDRLETVFTVSAIVKVGENTYTPDNADMIKKLSVADMVKEYKALGITKVDDLYDYLVKNGSIVEEVA